MAIIPTGYAQINLMFGGANLPLGAEVTYGCVVPAEVTDPQLLAETHHGFFVTNVLPYLNVNTTLTGAKCKFGPNDVGAFGEHFESVAGSTTGEALPPNVALLVKKRTALGGKRNRGRLYIPGIDEDTVDTAGVIDPTALVAMQADVTAWLADMVTNSTGMRILHTEPPGEPTIAVTSLVLDGRAATQRRRLRR